MAKKIRLATDVGGTFTDLVYYEVDAETGRLRNVETEKVHTTPPNFEEGVLQSFHKARIPVSEIEFLAHGTTVVINALTERRGVKTGLITTRGFRDVLEIGRGDRPDFFNLKYRKPPAFVPRHLRLEITERIDHRGQIRLPLAEDEISSLVETFKAEGVEAIAVCLLHSYANPEHERALLEAFKEALPEVTVVASHQITRMWREYERTNTTVLCAYVQPITKNYLDRLEAKLEAAGFAGAPYIMQSNGGIDTIETARATPITMVESGPASGMLGAAALGQLIGEPNIIALDIGGTTAKCSLIDDGKVQVKNTYTIERSKVSSGYPTMIPVVDIVEIGNGGGSIAWLDAQGKLHVGPKSAGAVPGPVAYGQGGTEPTTTDANLLTGRINPSYFCGGEIDADMVAVEEAFENLGRSLGLSAEDAARGVIRIANNNMVNALKLVSINRGYDPRDFTMVAFGGGGTLHATALARELNIPKVVIPAHSSVFSAWGMLMSDLRRDWILTRPTALSVDTVAEIDQVLREMEEEARRAFEADGFYGGDIRFERMVDMRYEGQEHTVRIRLPADRLGPEQFPDILERFQANYEREYTYRLDNEAELVSYHLAAFVHVAQPEPPRLESGRGGEEAALKGRRMVDFGDAGRHETPIYDRDRLGADAELLGPAIIEESGSTSVVPPGGHLRVDAYGNLHITGLA